MTTIITDGAPVGAMHPTMGQASYDYPRFQVWDATYKRWVSECCQTLEYSIRLAKSEIRCGRSDLCKVSYFATCGEPGVSVAEIVRETHGMNGQSAHAVSPQPTETPEESANKEAISVILNPDQWKVVLQALDEQVTIEGREDEVATCIENQTEGLL